MKIIAKMAVWAAVAGVSLPASAANLYVTPWYANPTCTEWRQGALRCAWHYSDSSLTGPTKTI